MSSTHVSPTNVGAPESVVGATAKSWACGACSAVNSADDDLYCPICLLGRPMERRGTPQFFTGLVFHFNGIIPRTLKHPSHSVEWRMAERHGATVVTNFDAKTVTTLIYRPGYERSDKVKLAVEEHQATIMSVPINWLLDSLLQSRQIHPALYRLKAIPSVALPTVRGNVLPHHQHPFFVLNAEEYALFPLPKHDSHLAAMRRGAGANRGAAGGSAGDGDEPPKPREIPPFRWERVSVWEAAAKAAGGAGQNASEKGEDDDDEDNEFDGKDSRATRGVDFLKASHNRRNPVLFAGLVLALSETLREDADCLRALRAFGAKVVDLPADPTEVPSVLTGPQHVSHILYHRDDKKRDFMIEAAACASGVRASSNIVFADALWAEDSMMLDELLPPVGPYAPSVKLLATLAKKKAKREKD